MAKKKVAVVAKASPKKKKAVKSASPPADWQQELIALLPNVQVRDIILLGCQAGREDLTNLDDEIPFDIQAKGYNEVKQDEGTHGTLDCYFDFTLIATARKSMVRTVISAGFRVRHNVKPGTPPLSLDLAEAFSQEVAIYTVWPYWREFVQSTVTRMGLPALAVPMVRRVVEAGKAEPAQSAGHYHDREIEL